MAIRGPRNAARCMFDPASMPGEEFERYLVRVLGCLDRQVNRREAEGWRKRRHEHRLALLLRIEALRFSQPLEVVSPEGDVLPYRPDQEPL